MIDVDGRKLIPPSQIIVYERDGALSIKVVTATRDGNETIDYCSLEEIEKAFEMARSAIGQQERGQHAGHR